MDHERKENTNICLLLDISRPSVWKLMGSALKLSSFGCFVEEEEWLCEFVEVVFQEPPCGMVNQE